MVTLTPSPLTVVVLVSMNNVFHLRILLCNPLFQYCCKNNRTLGASSLSSTSIFYLQCRPWFNIYHFIQLCSCTLEGTSAGGSFRYSSIFSQLPKAGEARRDLLNSVKLKTQLWYFNALTHIAVGSKSSRVN